MAEAHNIMTSQLIAMGIFSLTMSITPGPVNMINLASGATHGLKKTIPFVTGSTIGFILLLITLSIGFMQVIAAYPLFLKYMSMGGRFYSLYELQNSHIHIGHNRPEHKMSKIHGRFLPAMVKPQSLACMFIRYFPFRR